MKSSLRRELALELAPGQSLSLLMVQEPRARRLRLTFSERGARLSVPPGVSERRALAFVHEQRVWLREQLARLPSTEPAPLEIGQSSALPLRDASLPVVWLTARYAAIRRRDECVEISLPPTPRASALPRLLREFYLAEARADIGRWLPRYLPGLPRPPRSFRLAPLSSLWGSLNASAVVSLDLALVLAPPAAFEYVLVHELCHLLHPNHSAAFWAAVGQRLPDWRTQRRYLRDEGATFKRQLRALLDV